MNREQATYTLGGMFFGFVAGFVLAYALTAPTTASRPAGMPAPPNPGSTAPGPGPAGAADPHADVMSLLAELREKLQQDPDDVPVLLDLSHLYMQAGMAEQALEYLQRVTELEPENYQGLIYTAMALETTGQSDAARELIEQMMARDPGRWEPHYLLAAHYLHSGENVQSARQELDRVEELNPGMPAISELRLELERLEAEQGEGARDPG